MFSVIVKPDSRSFEFAYCPAGEQLVDGQESAEQQEAEIAEQKRLPEEYKDKFLGNEVWVVCLNP